MSLISLIVIIVAIGVILWAVNKYIPMEPNIRNLLTIVVIVILVLWLLSLFGILPDLNAIRVGG
jgi:hypothetical protein